MSSTPVTTYNQHYISSQFLFTAFGVSAPGSAVQTVYRYDTETGEEVEVTAIDRHYDNPSLARGALVSDDFMSC